MNLTRTSPDPASGLPPEETARAAVAAYARLDPDRAAALAGLSTLREVAEASLRRERALIIRRYGEGDARLAAIETRLAVNTLLRRDLAAETAAAATPFPTVPAGGYVFHGFVRTAEGEPAPQLTLALYGEDGGWLQAFGYGCTDARGYFLLRYQPKETDEKSQRAATKESVAEVRLYDREQRLVQREPDPLQPRPDAADYREIVLREGGAGCVPPPDAPNQPPPPPAPKDKPDTGGPPSGSGTVNTTPLENIKGIGPARAAALRKMGIVDVETLLNTPTEKLVGLAGFDAEVVKREAQKAVRDAQKKPPA